MSLSAKIFLTLGAICGVSLVALRLVKPEIVVSLPLGFGLNCASVWLLVSGFAEYEGISVRYTSPGHLAVLSSWLPLTILIDFALRLNYLSEHWSPQLSVNIITFGLLALLCWSWAFQRRATGKRQSMSSSITVRKNGK